MQDTLAQQVINCKEERFLGGGGVEGEKSPPACRVNTQDQPTRPGLDIDRDEDRKGKGFGSSLHSAPGILSVLSIETKGSKESSECFISPASVAHKKLDLLLPNAQKIRES